ncbi:MAG: HPr kinase/phosphatase C-terminal domain-containing protein [Pseudomonadota bacterium]
MGDIPSPGARSEVILHATTIAHGGQALLLTGAAGSGKSSLALACIGLGAVLVADDRTVLRRDGPVLEAQAPDALTGLIEVRGLGLLRLPHAGPVPVAGVVDLDIMEEERLPPRRTTALLGVPVTLYRRLDGAHVPAALLQCLAGARAVSAMTDDPSP